MLIAHSMAFRTGTSIIRVRDLSNYEQDARIVQKSFLHHSAPHHGIHDLVWKGRFMTKNDRRVQRTRELLQNALIELIGEQSYEVITIQDITDRANVGRTTFYLHYDSKDELFMDCHETIINEFDFGSLHPLSRAEMLSPEAPSGMALAFRHLGEVQALLYFVFKGKDSPLFLRRIRDLSAQEIEVNLRATFAGAESGIPLDVLANYLAGAQLALVQWWLEKRQPHPPEDLAQAIHSLQRAAIREAFGLRDSQ